MTSSSVSARLASLLAICALSTSCGSTRSKQDTPPYPGIEATDLGEMRNVSSMGSIWIGAMPCAEDLELAQRRGIELVIDLSTPDEQGPCDIGAVCKRLSLEYSTAAMRPEEAADDESVDFVMELLANSAAGPSDASTEPIQTLMVDGSGGRCATFLAIYRVQSLNVPLEQALVDARRAGMKPGAPEEFVRAQVARLSALHEPVTGS